MGVTRFDRDWKPAQAWIVTKGSGPLRLELGDRLTFEGPGDGGNDSILKVSGRAVGDQCRYDPSSDTARLYVGVEPFTVTRDATAHPPTLTFISAISAEGGLGGNYWMAEEGKKQGSDMLGEHPLAAAPVDLDCCGTSL